METTTLTPAATAPRLAGWLVRIGSLALTVLLVAAWFVVLRPGSLGGQATYVIVSGSSMHPTLASGDLVIAFEQRSYAVGDIVVYDVPAAEAGGGTHIVHRIVGGEPQRGFVVKGDSRDKADHWRPRAEEVVGKVRVSVPYLGSALVVLRQPLGIALLGGFLAFLVVLWTTERSRAAAARRPR